MRNRGLLGAALAAVVLASAATAQEADRFEPPRDELERRQARIAKPSSELVSINAALMSTVQWIAASNHAAGALFGAGSVDLNVTVRPREDVRLFLDAEALIGPGPDRQLGTLSRLNTDAERLEGAQKRLVIRELFLRLAWHEEHVRFSIGKLDVNHYFDRNFFAEDETTQFLDMALLNSPLLKPPPNGPGAAVRVSVGDWRYAFGVHAPGDFDGDVSGLPYVIGELGHRNVFALAGHYRLWARVSAVPEARDHVTWGVGVSIDQLVTPDLGVFLRASLARSDGQGLTSRAWSSGIQLAPTRLGRVADRFGIGYTFQHEPAGRERLVEAYYKLALADWMFFIGNVQWLISGPNQVTGGTNRNVVIPGLRGLVLF